jgi:50S ribosomal subunit-associated GTPase HflX
MPDLHRKTAHLLGLNRRPVTLALPYCQAGLLDSLYRGATVERVSYEEEHIAVTAHCDAQTMGAMHQYVMQ